MSRKTPLRSIYPKTRNIKRGNKSEEKILKTRRRPVLNQWIMGMNLMTRKKGDIKRIHTVDHHRPKKIRLRTRKKMMTRKGKKKEKTNHLTNLRSQSKLLP
jgi:hypothetical protein